MILNQEEESLKLQKDIERYKLKIQEEESEITDLKE